MRPESSARSSDSLGSAGRPVDDVSAVIEAAAGPEETFGELTGLVHEVLGLQRRNNFVAKRNVEETIQQGV